jgi:AcrR family transcriptional regulator
MTSDTAPLGMRERKRREVRARIEEAALFLALRDGLDATTVDAISERADVSPRTFFNYFDTKDSAVLGVHQADLTDDLAAEHVARAAGQPLVSSLVELVLAVMGAPTAAGAVVHRDRVALVKRHPQVLAGQFAQIAARNEWLVGTAQQIIAAAGGTEPGGASRAEAEVLLGTCGAAIRTAVREWADAEDPGPVDDIQRRAVALVHQIVRKLS